MKKLKGKHEKNFGDIAIIINLVMKNNEIIRGIGFLEAKKRDKDKLNFSAIKIPQLKRIKKNAPSSLVLLYDYDKITDIPHSLYDWDSLRCREYCFPNHLNFTQFTHCVVIPISLPIYKKDKTTSYYKFGIPFSYQIFFRYFHGLDLEYIESDSEIETLFNSVGYPTFIIQAGISRGIEGPRMPDLRQIQGQYQSIE